MATNQLPADVADVVGPVLGVQVRPEKRAGLSIRAQRRTWQT